MAWGASGGAAGETGLTDVARAEQRRNEAGVLADGALLGERRAAWVRIIMMVAFGLTEEVIGPAFATRRPWDDLRMGMVALYAVFALVTLRRVRQIRSNPRLAFWMPFMVTVIDYGAMAFFGWRDYQTSGRLSPQMGAVAFALVMVFSVVRVSLLHIGFSTLLACASYLGLTLYTGQGAATDTSFVLAGFVALGLLLALTNRAVQRMFQDLRRRDALSRFLPRAVADRVLRGGGAALQPVQREVTVLFSDIRGFTALSEAASPREVLAFLDDYFGRMAQVVKGHDGMVNKFLGDGMLAVWGVPDVMPDHAAAALRAALDMQLVVGELNRVRADKGQPEIKIGVGVHSGVVAAGTLGGSEQHEYTVIGDAVNVAARIESMTKELGEEILVSARAWQLAGGGFRARKLAEPVKLKGRAEGIELYGLEGRK